MEDLIQLVAASFARHGIECPTVPASPTSQAIRTAEPPLPTVLPEHNYRKKLEGDPAP